MPPRKKTTTKSQPRTPAKAPKTPNPPRTIEKGKTAAAAAAAKARTDKQRQDDADAESRRLAREDLEDEQEDSDDDEPTNLDDPEEEEEEEEEDAPEWSKDDDFPFDAPAGMPESTELPPTSDEEVETGASGSVDVIDITSPPRRIRKKRTNSELSPLRDKAASKTRKTTSGSSPSAASSDQDPDSSDSGRPVVKLPRVRVPRPMHGLNGKVTLSAFDKRDEPELLHALKEYARYHVVIVYAIPHPALKKAPYWVPVLEEYIHLDTTPVHYKEIWARWKKDPIVIEAACEHVFYTRADIFRLILKSVKTHVSVTGVPGPSGRYSSREIADRVAWHFKHRIYHHGEFDWMARTWDAGTAYEALWVVDCIREFMYDNRGGLDGLAFLWLKNEQKISMPMLALYFTAMHHFVSMWETGSHNPKKTFGDQYHPLYSSILTGIIKLEKDVPGWFDQHSRDLFVAAALQSNKPYMIETPDEAEDVNEGVDTEAVRARVEAKTAARLKAQADLAVKVARAAAATGNAQSGASSDPAPVV